MKPCEGNTIENVVDDEENYSGNTKPIVDVKQDECKGAHTKKGIGKIERSETEKEVQRHFHAFHGRFHC